MATATPAPEPSGYDPAKLYMWIKSLESKVNNLIREMDLLKNSSVKKAEEMKRELKMMNEELLAIKSEQQKTSEKMDLIIKELKQTAGIEEVMVLKKYVDLWNPMNFVTQRDLDRALNAKLTILKEVANKQTAVAPK
ncbi:MAG: hypothetical protein V2A62_02975 [Candidatus Woesearchaeota archaeon]